MAKILEAHGLSKSYGGFTLKEITFALEEERIAGILGNRGAGKTTLIKLLLKLRPADQGDVSCFGLDFTENESPIRRRSAYIPADTVFYGGKRIGRIVDAMQKLYDNWDPGEFEKYRTEFRLLTDQTPARLTPVMRVKLQMALALGHRAKLLVLDDPTAGMEIRAREELTDCFWYLKKQGVTVLFSTETASDVEKCADDLIFIRDGTLITAEPVPDFIAFHRQMGFGETLEDINAKYNKEALHEKPIV